MALDLAEAIVARAQELEDTENVCQLKLSVNMLSATELTKEVVEYAICKTAKYVKIKHDNMCYKVIYKDMNSNTLRQLWRLIINDKLRLMSRRLLMIKGMAVALSKNGKICLFDTYNDIIVENICPNVILDFLVLTCDPNVTIE